MFLRAHSLEAQGTWQTVGTKVELKRPGKIGVVLHCRRGADKELDGSPTDQGSWSQRRPGSRRSTLAWCSSGTPPGRSDGDPTALQERNPEEVVEPQDRLISVNGGTPEETMHGIKDG